MISRTGAGKLHHRANVAACCLRKLGILPIFILMKKIFSFLLPDICVTRLYVQGDTRHISSGGKLKPVQVNRDIWHYYKKVTIQ